MKRNRSASNRAGGTRGAGASGGAVVDEGALECSLEELREFIEADLVNVHADLEFKHSLRERLWNLVQARNAQRGRGPSRR
ncbi:MAG: hypothetical protein ACE5FG_15255 [Myxococcota bacterium]